MYFAIMYHEEEQWLALLACLLPLIKDANPADFAWHVGSQAVGKATAKDSGSRVKKTNRRALGSFKYDLFTGFYNRNHQYLTVTQAAQECGHTPERIKSTVLSGLDQGQLERVCRWTGHTATGSPQRVWKHWNTNGEGGNPPASGRMSVPARRILLRKENVTVHRLARFAGECS